MKNLKLPLTIDPRRSAQRLLMCEGYFELIGLDRLLAISEKSSEQVNVKMNFDVDEQGLIVISGNASTKVSLTCQRCTEAYEEQLNVEFCFSPVKNEEDASHLPSEYDAVELDENGEVNLRDLVEDELILAVPLIPKHKLEDCSADADTTWGKLPEVVEKPNPFDLLKQLK